MVCTFSQLFWQLKVAENCMCAGAALKLGNLNQNVDHVLANFKCKGANDPPITMTMLLLNRLTPYDISPDSVSTLDICKSHLVS